VDHPSLVDPDAEDTIALPDLDREAKLASVKHFVEAGPGDTGSVGECAGNVLDRDFEPDCCSAFGQCRLDVAARVLTRDGTPVALSPKEFELLEFLARNAGRALSREQIMNAVWGYDCAVTPRTIDRFVNALRQKIEPEPSQPQWLTTVREFGYRFTAP
jgi:DNA-binding winged helix-turn-helix (wHTH) protein